MTLLDDILKRYKLYTEELLERRKALLKDKPLQYERQIAYIEGQIDTLSSAIGDLKVLRSLS